jgi:hypothetical protein
MTEPTGQCLDIAAEWVIAHPEDTMVIGKATLPDGTWVDHAWVLRADGSLFDPSWRPPAEGEDRRYSAIDGGETGRRG